MGENYCSFIGQRPITFSWGYDEENETFLAVRGIMKNAMTALVKSGTKNFISDMSLGIPLVGAELAMELRDELDSDIRLICALPYEKQAEKWAPNHRDRYFELLSRCNKDIVLQSEYSDDCYRKCNMWICRYATHIIAVCDDMPLSSAGKRIQYARNHHVSLTIINPCTLEVTEKHFSKKYVTN